MSSAVMVSGIEICFSTDSLGYRSSRRIQISSETAFEVDIAFFVRDLTAIAIEPCRREQIECLLENGSRIGVREMRRSTCQGSGEAPRAPRAGCR